MPTHAFVALDEYGQSADIDEGMVDLIRALWRHGITTTGCCQGDPDKDWNSAYVAIEAYDMPRFLALVGDHLEVTAYAARERLRIHLGAQEAFVSYWAKGMREDFDGGIYYQDGEWHVSAVVRFPPSFIPELAALLEDA